MMEKLLKSLNLKEKIGQLAQLGPFLFISDLKVEIAGYVRHLKLDEEKIFSSGSVLGIGSASEMIQVQKKYLEKSRHKIPLVFMADVIHGYKTIFPVPIALASSWNTDLARLTARVSALEASTSGIHVTFSPMVDLARDPRWGRVVEGFGEDPYLSGQFAAAMVKGYQNDGIGKPGNIAACVKHFAGYGASEAGRDYNAVDLSRLQLFQFYLPSYRKAIEAGARLVMTAFNTLDGVPCTVNTFLLRDILRTKWNFQGITISDYDSLQQTITHGYCENQSEAATAGIESGLDIEMASTNYLTQLEKLVADKVVPEALIDEAVLRILELKRDLGLFEDPYKGADDEIAEKVVLSEAHLESSYRAALESAVLLTNNGILPLDNQAKLAIIGPYATSKNTIGPWSWHGRRDLHESIAEVFAGQTVYVSDLDDAAKLDDEAIKAIREADVVLLPLGEREHDSGEAHSRSDITLPGKQASLVHLVKELGKPCVVLLHNGRPLILENILEADAIVECWFLGSQHAKAIRSLLTGEANPSGKLTISFPKSQGQIPLYYNHFNTGRPFLGEGDDNEYVSKYIDIDNFPRFPFGYGLSYSRFVFSDLSLSAKTIKPGEELLVTVDIRNLGPYPGMEVVQLYLRDMYAQVVRPVRELKRWQKVFLENQAKGSVTFTLTLDDLTYMLPDGTKVYDPGEYVVMVGNSSTNLIEDRFSLVKE